MDRETFALFKHHAETISGYRIETLIDETTRLIVSYLQ